MKDVAKLITVTKENFGSSKQHIDRTLLAVFIS